MEKTVKYTPPEASLEPNHDPRPSPSLPYAERADQLARAPTPLLVRGDRRLLRDVTRGPPGDPPFIAPRRQQQQQQQQQRLLRRTTSALFGGGGGGVAEGGTTEDDEWEAEAKKRGSLARKRSRYFEEAFSVPRRRSSGDGGTAAAADEGPPARARAVAAVRGAAPVLVELRTNVAFGGGGGGDGDDGGDDADERWQAVVADLAAHVAVRYRRPAGSVVVALQHSACLCFGGSFAPAYELAVHALPAELQPATNKRNTALLQRYLAAVLGVPPARGLLRFVPVPETNLAYGGRTAAGHMEAKGDDEADWDGGVRTATTMATESCGLENSAARSFDGGDRSEHKTSRKLSVRSLSSSFRSTAATSRTTPRRRNSSSATTLAAASSLDAPSPLLPAIPERVLKEESLFGGAAATADSGQDDQSKQVLYEQRLQEQKPRMRRDQYQYQYEPPLSAPPSPTTSILDRQPSSSRRGARRTKSFVATLFGRSGGGGGSGGNSGNSGNSNDNDRSSSA